MKQIIYYLFFSLLFFSCSKDDESDEKIIPELESVSMSINAIALFDYDDQLYEISSNQTIAPVMINGSLDFYEKAHISRYSYISDDYSLVISSHNVEHFEHNAYIVNERSKEFISINSISKPLGVDGNTISDKIQMDEKGNIYYIDGSSEDDKLVCVNVSTRPITHRYYSFKGKNVIDFNVNSDGVVIMTIRSNSYVLNDFTTKTGYYLTKEKKLKPLPSTGNGLSWLNKSGQLLYSHLYKVNESQNLAKIYFYESSADSFKLVKSSGASQSISQIDPGQDRLVTIKYFDYTTLVSSNYYYNLNPLNDLGEGIDGYSLNMYKNRNMCVSDQYIYAVGGDENYDIESDVIKINGLTMQEISRVSLDGGRYSEITSTKTGDIFINILTENGGRQQINKVDFESNSLIPLKVLTSESTNKRLMFFNPFKSRDVFSGTFQY